MISNLRMKGRHRKTKWIGRHKAIKNNGWNYVRVMRDCEKSERQRKKWQVMLYEPSWTNKLKNRISLTTKSFQVRCCHQKPVSVDPVRRDVCMSILPSPEPTSRYLELPISSRLLSCVYSYTEGLVFCVFTYVSVCELPFLYSSIMRLCFRGLT